MERDARREHCIELFRLTAARTSQQGTVGAAAAGGSGDQEQRTSASGLTKQGSVPPKRHYSQAEGYAGSTLLGQANKAEKDMWAAALRSVLEGAAAAGRDGGADASAALLG